MGVYRRKETDSCGYCKIIPTYSLFAATAVHLRNCHLQRCDFAMNVHRLTEKYQLYAEMVDGK